MACSVLICTLLAASVTAEFPQLERCWMITRVSASRLISHFSLASNQLQKWLPFPAKWV